MKHIIYNNDNVKILNQLIDKNEKVDVIYIDPIYNAHNKYFKSYSDFNDDWETYIEHVLKLSSKTLADNGVIFIQIGDDSVCELKMICDKVFGAENKIAMFAVKTPNQTTGNNVLKNTDYILVYGKSSESRLYPEPKLQEARCTTGKENQTIKNITIPAGIRVEGVLDGVYNNEDIKRFDSNEDLILTQGPIIVENGRLKNEIFLKGRWSNPRDVQRWVTKFKTKNPEPIYNKYGKELVELYLWSMRFQPRMVKKGFETIPTFLEHFQSKGKNQLKEIIGEHSFTYPKDVELIKFLISIGTNKSDAIVLDFFAGSGTTLEAVVGLNEENDTQLKCILVEQDESTVQNIILPRISTLKTGYRPDGSKYSDGMNFEYEII